MFRKDVPYDNIKSHKKSVFDPVCRRYIFRKTTRGRGANGGPPPSPPIPPYPQAVLGLRNTTENLIKTYLHMPIEILLS